MPQLAMLQPNSWTLLIMAIKGFCLIDERICLIHNLGKGIAAFIIGQEHLLNP